MDNNLKEKLMNLLKEEADTLLESQKDIQEKLSQFNDIDNLVKILQNYDELKPVLQDFFAKKHENEKWGKDDGR